MKKNWTIKKGRNFLAFGWGKYGPYAVGTRRIRKGLYAKGSVGIKGLLAGLKHSGKRCSAQAMVNVRTGKPSFSVKRRRRRR